MSKSFLQSINNRTISLGLVGAFAVVALILMFGSDSALALAKDKLVATPDKGSAPLEVTFTARSAPKTDVGMYRVEFGDGSSSELKPLECPILAPAAGPCNKYPDMIAEHTYIARGTYEAKLQKTINEACLGGPMGCWSTVSTTTIKVSR